MAAYTAAPGGGGGGGPKAEASLGGGFFLLGRRAVAIAAISFTTLAKSGRWDGTSDLQAIDFEFVGL